ncbi:unnamed protein product, partial [marine sediment metagenome]
MNTLLKSMYISLALFCLSTLHAETTLKITPITKLQSEIVVTIPVKKGHYLHTDSIKFSIDSPNVALSSQWKPSATPISYYDESFKETKKAFDDTFDVAMHITGSDLANNIDDVNLHLSYYSTDTHSFTNEVLPLTSDSANHIKSSIAVNDAVVETKKNIIDSTVEPCRPAVCKKRSWSEQVSSLIKTTDSLWIKIL